MGLAPLERRRSGREWSARGALPVGAGRARKAIPARSHNHLGQLTQPFGPTQRIEYGGLPPARRPLAGDELGAEYVDLLLELGDPDDRLGGALLGLVEAAGQADALALGQLGATGLGVAPRVASAARRWAATSASSSSCSAVSRSVSRALRTPACSACSAVREVSRSR